MTAETASPAVEAAPRRRTTPSQVLSRVLICLVGLVFLFPFLWMIATSLKPTEEVFASGTSLLGSRIEWSNYTEAWTAIPFGRILVNSFAIALLGALLTVTVSVLSAYAFSRFRFRGRAALFGAFLATMVLPQEVLIIPLYLMMQQTGLVNSYPALILPFAFGAFGTFLIRQFLLSLPPDYEEAATIDGASRLRTLVSVVVPLLRAPIAVVFVFAFIEYWGSFLWPLIIVNDASMATVPIGLQMFSGERGTDWGPMMAAVTLVVLPSLLIVILLQKQLQQGVSMGGFGGR
ncbi:carbohydrate ABC transporter permease [Brachybacterium alimentarium]|uniref:carbohydrate ABC transporter permease n=1 Tax=Brachybacterium alimentarium TaxID=47845 RepID=UPI000DF44D0F|nr:carbohydrate ABC transporter permease [Brachybacterium alimentarium]RCS71537.1 carbohydrate ABC transporter permease [Brachybacterium alimentarium]RCS77044.1 carbohydrate ABC transporter permease [Brachybacterium alimentarium]